MCLWFLADLGPQSAMKRSVLRQRRANAWGVRRHPVDPGRSEGEKKNADRFNHRGFPTLTAMASALRHSTIMKRRGVLKIVLILAGTLILTQCRPPTPVAAAVEFAPGVGADADQPVIKELVAAFNEAEAAVKKVDLDALMKFYATTYNYHGLKRSDVRRVWEEVFLYYRDVRSSHVFTELKLVQADGVRKAYVTCTGGLHGTEQQTGKPITIDSWAREVHYLVKEEGAWRFLGNAGGAADHVPAGSAPHHPLF